MESQAFAHVTEVCLHSGGFDRERQADPLVVEALTLQREDLMVARREGVVPIQTANRFFDRQRSRVERRRANDATIVRSPLFTYGTTPWPPRATNARARSVTASSSK